MTTDAHAPAPTAATMAVFAGILHRNRTHPDEPVPALNTLISGWTGHLPHDTDALQRLYAARVLTVSGASSPGAHTTTDGISIVYTAHVRFELTGGSARARTVYERMVTKLCAPTLYAAHQRARLARIVTNMETRAVVRYTDAILITRHGLPAIHEDLLSLYTALITDGLASGYTCRQLAALAWQAACDASTDAAPTRSARDVSTTVVTSFRDRLGRARPRHAAIPEHDIPTWAAPPVSLFPARILLHHVTASTESDHR